MHFRFLCFVVVCAVLPVAILTWKPTHAGSEWQVAAPSASVPTLQCERQRTALRDPESGIETGAKVGETRVEVASRSPGQWTISEDEPLGLIVRGQLQCAEIDLSKAQVTLRSTVDRREVELATFATAQGTYEFDATSLLSKATRMDLSRGVSQGFRMTVTHPRCSDVQRQVSLGDGRPRLPSCGSDRDLLEFVLRLGRNECVVDLVLRPCAIVRGTLVGGIPLPRDVTVCAALNEAAKKRGWIQKCVPDDHGRFELRLAEGARYAIVAVARDFRPTTEWIDLPVAGSYRIALSLDLGLSISGRLHLGSEAAPCGTSIDLSTSTQRAGKQLAVWREPAPSLGELLWIDGAFEWRTRSTRTLADGSFLVSGLAALDYDVRALGLGMRHVEVRSVDLGRVRAPATGLEMGPLLATLDLDLGPTTEGEVHFSLLDVPVSYSRALGPYRTDARGLARLLLPPLATFDVRTAGAVIGRVTTARAGEQSAWALAR
jgi:hypothetical protein